MSLPLLPIQAANTSLLTGCNRSPLRLPKMREHICLKLHWLSFPGWHREHISLIIDYSGGQYIEKEQYCTINDILRLTVGYLHATINRKTLQAEPVIGPEGSTQTWQNLGVDRYWCGLELSRPSRVGFGTGQALIWTIFPIWTHTTGRLTRLIAISWPEFPGCLHIASELIHILRMLTIPCCSLWNVVQQDALLQKDVL